MRPAFRFALLPILLFGLAACTSDAPEPVAGNPAPDFELLDVNGQTVRLSDQQGKAVVVNFWATWCAPCRFEMPTLDAAARQYPDDLLVLAVNYDEPPERVRAYADELGLGFAPLLDPGGETQTLYRVRGYPSTYFVDREGVIQAVHIGMLTEDSLAGYLAELGLP
ncbi:MAG: TlpA family protein disulfide reductase [Chloroflexi bacterium]|nr:TlpA family protein disulfide reductase [Chloroflexota bacterium]